MQARGHKQWRVILRGNIVVGRIGLHPKVRLRLVWVSPLVVLSGRERNAVVEHRRDDIHKRNCRDDARPKVRTLVDHGTHEESAGTSAHGKQLRSQTLAAKHFAAGDKVAEAVLLVLHSAVLVPEASEVFTAANVGNRIGHSALQKTQARNAECGIDGNAVGPITVKQRGHSTLAISWTNPAHGNLGSVWSRRPQPARHVAARVIASHHLLNLFDHLFAGDHIKIVGRGRSRQRRVHIAQGPRGRRGIRRRVQRVGFFGHGDGVLRSHCRRIPRSHHDAQQSALAFLAHHKIVKQIDALEQHVCTVRNHFRPLPGLVFRRLKQRKIGPAPEVASNPPARTVVAR